MVENALKPFAKIAVGVAAAIVFMGSPVSAQMLSPEDEQRIGREEHPKVLQQFGGQYDSPRLVRYINGLGEFLASASEIPGQKFTFTVLDTPIVNALALPGGYVYLTRGLLALGEDEAEIAAVTAHEIGHIAGRHTAKRYDRSIIANIGSALLGAVTGSSDIARLANLGGALYVQGFSRNQEFEADLFGVKYLSRTGHDTIGMSSFLTKLQAQGRLEAEIAGRPGASDKFSLLQTHPRTQDRIRRAIEAAGVRPNPNPIVARDIYLRQIDGMIWGDNPDQGIIRDREFLHPKLKFRFVAPKGFRLINGATQVSGVGPGGARMIFTGLPANRVRSLREALTKSLPDVRLSNIESITVNGMPAETGEATVNIQRTQANLRLVVIGFDRQTIYRFLFLTPTSQIRQFSSELRSTTYSFRKLNDWEIGDINPNRISVIRVRRGDSIASIASRMPRSVPRAEQQFRVMNINALKDGLQAGEKVKTITDRDQ